MPIKTTGTIRKVPVKSDLLIKRNISKRRVCGYARVSTDSDEQKTSYKSQVDYYTNYIKRHENYEFVGLYSDEGISATNTKHRDGFNRMITDALNGKIDLIITKSISRFARNTVDSLSAIRKLKEKGVEVYFEKENIWTFDTKGELMISLLSSLAQDESRSISENSTWGIRKRFSDGYVRMRFNNFLGYEKGEDGKAKIIEKDAKVIRLIYKLFMEGYGYRTIAEELMKKHIKSPGGFDKWRDHTVKSILTNERYCGDALLQKNFTVDFLTKKTKKNEGEVPQYYIENDHDAIVSKELFNVVQDEVKKRSKESICANSISNKLICGYCNKKYGKKVWHSTDKYKKYIYQCNHKYEKHCDSRNLSEDEIKEIFIKALNSIIKNKKEIISDLKDALKYIGDNTDLIEKLKTLENKKTKLVDEINSGIYQSATTIKDKECSKKKEEKLLLEYEKVKQKITDIENKISENNDRRSKVELYIENLKNQNIVTEFNMPLWGMFLDKMIIYKDKIIVRFNDGREITV